MKVKIKTFGIGMEVKSNGMELEVRSADNKTQLGDCYITMTGLIWCDGKKDRKNGVRVCWKDFISICDSKRSLKAAIKAARAVE